MQKAEWFVDWFNSPYYHLLYNKRNQQEADLFMQALCKHLELQKGAHVWDLACGKGRHAISLNRMGYHVTATDLSPASIKAASESASDTLDFLVHDMREPFRFNYFDCVFNLFTSIGYFENEADNAPVFTNVCEALKPGASFVIDFFNAVLVEQELQPSSREQRGDITFNITRKIKNGKIIKGISYTDKAQNFYFEEAVSLLKLKDFKKFSKGSGLELVETFGNYQLEPFNEERSERLIMIFKK